MKQIPLLSFVGLFLVQLFLVGCATQSSNPAGGNTSSGGTQSSETNPASPGSAVNSNDYSPKYGNATPSDAEIKQLASDITNRWNQAKIGQGSKAGVDDYYHSCEEKLTEEATQELYGELPQDFLQYDYGRLADKVDSFLH
jgi:hypothetical protein